MDLIDREHRRDDMHIVPHLIFEQRSNRTIHDAGTQDSGFRRPSLPFNKTSGDLSRRVKAFFKIDEQREKVYPLPRRIRNACGRQYDRISILSPHRTVRLLRNLARFKNERLRPDFQ